MKKRPLTATIHMLVTGSLVAALLFGLLATPGVLFAKSGPEERFLELKQVRQVPDKAQAPQFVQDEVIVKFRGENEPRTVRVSSGSTVAETLSRFKNRADVLYAEPNYIAHALFVPNDPYFRYQWNFYNSQYGGINMPTAWDKARGNGVTVAVIDTGVAYENYGTKYKKAPDLAYTKFVTGYDYVNNDAHANDDNGHGTHVAGTVAQSTNNSTGVAGVAYQATIMPIKVLNKSGSGTHANIAKGIRFAADRGAKVINMSLGGSSGSTTLLDAIRYAASKGVVIVAAAGNNASGTVSYPAAYSEVIAVGATRFDETLAPYSNWGSAIDLVAPGGDTSVDQNRDGYGDGILQQTLNGSTTRFAYIFYQGTSMATPHVAGVAALVASVGVTDPAKVRSILQGTAEDKGTAGWDSRYGHGIVDANAALNSALGL